MGIRPGPPEEGGQGCASKPFHQTVGSRNHHPACAATARRLRRYVQPRLLCIDEVGYLSYDNRYADLLFEVVTRRYDAQKPLLLSTNKAFSEWSEVFPHAACVVTLVDRLIHRAEVIEIDAESYRLKEAKELNAARSKQRSKKKPPQA